MGSVSKSWTRLNDFDFLFTFPSGSVVKNLRAIWETQVRSLGQEEPLEKEWWLRRLSICLQCRRPGFDLWVGNFPWRRKWQPTPVLLPGKSHGRRSLVGYSPWGCKELDMTEQLHFISLLLHPLQYSCLENSMDRGAWWATSPRGHKKSETTERLTMCHF